LSELRIPRWAGIGLLLVIATVFGANHIAARIAFDHGTNVTTAVTIRSAGTALFVLLLLLLSNVSLKVERKTFGRAILIGLLISVQSYCLYSAVALIPVALAGLALALDVLGTSGAHRAGFAGRWTEVGAGVLWALGASVSFATALFLITRWLGSMDGRLRSFLFMSVVALVTLAGGTLAGGFALPADGTGWIALVLLTVLYGTAITSTFVLLPKLGAVNNAAVLNFEPITVLGLAWVILGQAVAPSQILGAFVVVGAIAWMGAGKR